MSKIQRTDTVCEVTTDPKTLHPIPAEHPHKTPSLQIAQATLTRSSSTVPAAAASDPHTTSPQTKSPKVIDVDEEVLKKLIKEGGYNFPPLSIGKALSDMWWEVVTCTPLPSKQATASYVLATVNVLIDAGGEIILPQEKKMQVTFKMQEQEILRLCFLRDRLCTELAASDFHYDFDKWVAEKVIKRHGVEMQPAVRACAVFNTMFTDASIPLPRRFRLFFCKRPHTPLLCKEGVLIEENHNCMVVPTNKEGFSYELRIRIFDISNAMMRGDVVKSKKDPIVVELPDDMPESQLF